MLLTWRAKAPPGGDFEGVRREFLRRFPLTTPAPEPGPAREHFWIHSRHWPHVKNDGSMQVLAGFGFLENYREGLFWVCFWHAPQGCPQASPKAPKRCPKTSPKVPKGHPKAPKAYPKVPKTPQRCPKGKGGIPKVGRPPPAPHPEHFWNES